MTINFPQNKHTRHEADLLKRAKNAPQSLSIDDMVELCEIETHIDGTVFHPERQERYDKLRDAVVKYIEKHGSKTNPLQMVEQAPSKGNMYAHIILYTLNPAGTQVKKLLPLLEATKLADEFTISEGDDEGVTMEFTWTVVDIWTEE